MLVGLVVGELVELLEEAALLRGDLSRHCDIDEYPVVAAPETLEDGHALATEHANLARLRARVELELLGAVDGLDLEAGAERCVDDGEVDLGEDVVPLADEARVLANADLDVGVAGPPAEPAGAVAGAGPASADPADQEGAP